MSVLHMHRDLFDEDHQAFRQPVRTQSIDGGTTEISTEIIRRALT